VADVLAGLPALPIHGLGDSDARALLLENVHGPLDAAVGDQLITESHGNPLALLELPRTWRAAELAGGFGLPGSQPVAGKIEQSYVRRLQLLPSDSRLLVLAAAAEPLGNPVLLRGAAQDLGIDMAAAVPAAEAGLLQVHWRVEFAHPLVRSAAYHAAATDDRYRVHRALAEATDAEKDPDRRAWHRARAAPGPDEAVAAELERSAGRAQARGGLVAAAAFLTRATELTPDPAQRVRRALDAAFASVPAGAFDSARTLLTIARGGPVDELQRARIDLLGAQLAFVSSRGNEATRLLLAAARRLEALSPELARQTYLDAFSAAQFAARLNDGVGVAEVARAARAAARPADDEPTAGDLLLDAFSALTDDYETAVPRGPGCVAEPPRRQHLGQGAAALAVARLRARPGAVGRRERVCLVGPPPPDRPANGRTERATAGPRLAYADPGVLRRAVGCRLAGRRSPVGCGGDGRRRGAVWRVDPSRMAGPGTRGERADRGHAARGHRPRRGVGVAICEYAHAVLCNGLGEYEEALAAARRACEDPQEMVAHNWGLTELIESAARTGTTDLATDALVRLARKAQASRTDWALGMAARSRALLSEGDDADTLYRESIAHLGRTRVRAELGRAHLLYGEWL
jgi:hypothetical protein